MPSILVGQPARLEHGQLVGVLALDALGRLGLVRPAATLPSDAGPHRTILQPTASGHAALAAWLTQPVEHVRDTRSLLMLKLLFLSRRRADPAPLLRAQRERFAIQADRLAAAADVVEGFDRTLLLWRMHTTTAAVRFTDAMLNEPVASGD